jgi:hypothetical protein
MYGPILTAVLASTAFFFEPSDSQREKSDKPAHSLESLAGEYFFSNGFSGERLAISADGRFKLTYHTCTGQNSTYGRGRFVNGHLVLRTYLVCRVFFDAPTDLIPIDWGDRLYLVPKGAGREFCDYVNMNGGATRWPPDPLFVRSGDDEKPVDGLPSVPKEWEPMLLPSPLNGKVVEVIGHSRARVDFGYEIGAWKGMPLWAECEGSPWVEAVAVHATNCVIESNHPATAFKIGDRVSSRRFERDRSKPAQAEVSRSPRAESP